ncbi:putative glycosyl transferase [Dissulfuribacter thermophilus]|uniref:Putative glycosyl transferase n=1 Tax=Dissulfuribacter thermophilus TaxID=1156395 RepID=A0A1B9F7V0_9BACT|nr:glycosyltransferase [Dissulfuribacter thermophilus]OCC15885.1 putative glycosyl transferase [Dissulfuribacter thermophilus]
MVSVIIPTYNNGSIINRAIYSALKQVEVPLEIIIVDDGSTDDTEKIVRSSPSSSVRYFFQKNAGPAAARNLGITMAKGEFIAFLDADDEWRPGYLKKVIDQFKKDEKIGLIFTWAILRDNRGNEVIRNYYSPSRNKWHTIFWPNPLQCTSSTVCRKSFLDKVGGFDESLRTREDQDLWIRLKEVSKLVEIPEPLVIVYKRDRSYSTRQSLKQMRSDYFNIIEKAFKRAPDLYAGKEKIIMAEAYRYWGQYYLYMVQIKDARRDLYNSLKYKTSFYTLFCLILSLMPEKILIKIGNYYKKLIKL